MAAKRQKIHFESVEELLGAPITKDITEEMKRAASFALANLVAPEELNDKYILPLAFDKRVGPAVAKAVADAARECGVARL